MKKTFHVSTYTLYEIDADSLDEAMEIATALRDMSVVETEIILNNAFHEQKAFINHVVVMENGTKAMNQPQ